MDLFAKRNPAKSGRSQEIKAQVSQLLDLSEETTVMVTELNCQDEDCPEVETVIAIFLPGRPKIQATLHSSIEEITEDEIERFCQNVQNKLQEAEVASAASEENNPTS
jgi:hypothetical protein